MILIIFPFVGVLWAAVVCLWLLDIGNNTTAEPYRAFLSDRLPKYQLARGFLTQSFYAGARRGARQPGHLPVPEVHPR